MNSIDEKPRTYPAPVPFLLDIPKPIVPEISLLSLDGPSNIPKEKDDSSLNPEFQSYNAWKWKYMGGSDKIAENKVFDKCNSLGDCILIKDKYFSSETEKRKNELLYGQIDEPRKPLIPKIFPKVPCLSDPFLSNNKSFEELNFSNEKIEEKNEKYFQQNFKKEHAKNNDDLLDVYIKKGLSTSNKLYNIMTQQNNQIQVLQKQIEQTLKLQDVKDKQIEQLLNFQESKERKIELLLQSSESKDKEIDRLLKLKEKNEKQIRELLKLQEDWEQKNLELAKRVNAKEKTNTHSVCTMTDFKMIDCGTNTSINYLSQEDNNKREQNSKDESCIRASNETSGFHEKDRSISLSSVDLPVIEEQVLTPQSSIHVDIQDFHYSSDESGSNSDAVDQNILSSQLHSSKLGFTFYNNVISQVKNIIQNSGSKDMESEASKKIVGENHCVREKNQSIQKLEILERENISPNRGSNNFNRFFFDLPNTCVKDTYSPSDISIKMNSLALKYLKQEQISQYNVQTQISAPRHPDVTIYNVTNLSFGSARYLDKYHVLSDITEQHNFSNGSSPSNLNERNNKMILQ